MKARNLTSIAISTALISSALISPAVANGTTVLPFNANANDNSGVHVQACEEYLQISLPSTMADDPHDGNPFLSEDIPPQPYEAFYLNQEWIINNANSTTALDSEKTLDATAYPYQSAVIEFDPSQSEGSSIDLSLKSIGVISGILPVESAPFDITNIEIQSTSGLSGDGSESNPYLITDSDDLNLMRCDLDAHYKLTADIDMNGVSWLPVGLRSDFPFSGVLDGNNKTISNLTIDTVSEHASFLGQTAVAQIFDLSFDSPIIEGIDNVSVITSYAESAIISNITIANMQITAMRQAGGIVAETENGSLIKNIEISGVVDVPMVYSRDGDPEGTLQTFEFNDFATTNTKIALVAGGLDSGGDSLSNVTASGDINVAPLIAGESTQDALDVDNRITFIALLVGDNDSNAGIIDSTVDGEINIDARSGLVSDIGGAYGSTMEGGTLSHSSIDANIHLNAQALADGSSNTDLTLRDIGVVAGAAEYENYFHGNTLRGSIEIEDSTGNSSSVTVSNIGSFGTPIQDTSISNMDSNVSIKSEFTVDRVALATGFLGGFSSVSDSVFQGVIDVPADSTRVAGFAGDQRSNLINLRNVLIAVQFRQGDFQSVISNTTSDAKTGSAKGVFFDSDLNNTDPGEFTSGPAGRSATTEQLKSKSFLEDAGYDFENDWFEADGEYPTPIKPSSDSSSTSTPAPSPSPSFSSAPAPAAVVVNAVGNAELGPNGGVITITGKSLTGVRLSLGETPLFVQLRSDTEALVQIPAGLAPGSYDLTATGANGVLTSQDVFTITDLTTTSDTGFWTTRNGDNVKIYAKNIIGSGKVQFFVNGEEIAWVNATDNSDEKLRVINEGPMAGNVYLVRDKDLLDGKNVFEIYVDGERVERRVASK